VNIRRLVILAVGGRLRSGIYGQADVRGRGRVLAHVDAAERSINFYVLVLSVAGFVHLDTAPAGDKRRDDC
jgi:hypothetical protein